MGNSWPVVRHHARQLRATSTPEERILWDHVRKRRLGGLKFRRQWAAYAFVLDFYCPEARLGVELDGRHHEPLVDADRDARLACRGIHVIRFPNLAVTTEIERVLTTIEAEARARLFRPRGAQRD